MQSGPSLPRPKAAGTMLEAALRYLHRGWSVLPTGSGKRPIVGRWEEYQRRTPTEGEVREWWTRWPDSGVGVVTGSVSGVVVVDADGEEGERSAAALIQGPTLTARTGGGGRHFYLKHPGGHVPCAVRFKPGLDCRGDGGFAVLPPSPHASGKAYRWENEADVSAAPARLLQELHSSRPGRGPVRAEDWAANIAEGERDQELTRRAGRLFRAGIPIAEVLDTLLYVNASRCKPPLPPAQVEKIVHSISNREAARTQRETARAFTVLTQREMLRRYGEDETRWAVHEWLPDASCGLLVAPPGNFKTWMLAALAYSVSTGRPFLGKYPVVHPGPVLFIQQEDPWGMLQGRLGRMFPQQPPAESGSGPDARFELDCRYVEDFDSLRVHWYTDRQLNFSDAAVVARLEAKVAELRPRVVIVDPLYTAADTKDYMAEGAQRMVALKLMRDRHRCSFVVAHHTTVAGATSEGREAIWGSQFLNAWLEFGWRMPKGDDKGNVVLRHFKDAESPKRIKIKFEISDFGFHARIDENCAASVTERIEEIILSGGGASTRQIAGAAGCSPSAVSKVARRMGLEKDKQGYYRRDE